MANREKMKEEPCPPCRLFAKGTDPTYQLVSSTNLFLHLVQKPPVKVNTVSLGLLKTTFPSGVVANWPKVSKGLSHRAKKQN